MYEKKANMTKREYVEYVMRFGNNYEYCGEEHSWHGYNIHVKVVARKDLDKMHKAAYTKIAKYICTHCSSFKQSDWKYINRIDFDIVEKAPKKVTKKTQPILEYVNLFGEPKQVLSNGKERAKPIPKGELFDEKTSN